MKFFKIFLLAAQLERDVEVMSYVENYKGQSVFN